MKGTDPNEGRPGYKETTLGKIAKIVSGGTPSRAKPEYWGGDVPWVKTASINYQTILSGDEYLTQEGLKSSSTRMIPKGTILMAMYGQGKTRGQVGRLGIEAAINQACAALLLKDGVNRDFVYCQLVFQYSNIRNLSNSGNQDNLNASLIRSIR